MAKDAADVIHGDTLSPWLRRLIRAFAQDDPLLAAGLRMVLCGENIKDAARLCALDRHVLGEKVRRFVVMLKSMEAEDGLDPFDLVVEQPMDARPLEKAPPGYNGRLRPPAKIELGSCNTNPNPAPKGPPPVSQVRPIKRAVA